MIRKILNLFFEIIGDFESCKNRAQWFITISPIGRIIFLVGVIFVAILALFAISNPDYLIIYFLKVVSVTVITFIIYVWSDTFWFLIKKAWMYKLLIRNREGLDDLLKSIDKIILEEPEAEHPEGAIYILSQFYFSDLKYNAKRSFIEVVILLIFLLFTFPLFFVLNLILIGISFLYVFLYELQPNDQVFNDMKILIKCVYILYKNNPENCRKFILDNKMASVQELSSIYRAIKRASVTSNYVGRRASFS